MQEIQKLTKAEKTKLVREKHSYKQKEPVELKDLTYTKKIYLLAVFRVLTDESFDKILPLDNSNHIRVLSPSRDMDNNILDCLYTEDVILVDPISNLDAFVFKKGKYSDFKLNNVSWIVNVSSESKERLHLATCYRMIYDDLTNYFPTSTDERNLIYSFTMNLALNEIENYLFFKMKELNYKYEFGKKTYNYIYQLLRYLSVSEIYSIVDKSVAEDYILNSRSESNIKFYGNTITTKLIEFGELAKRNVMSLKSVPRKECLQRSEISKVFYELIHDVNDEGFSECPLTFWNNTLKYCYTTDSG